MNRLQDKSRQHQELNSNEIARVVESGHRFLVKRCRATTGGTIIPSLLDLLVFEIPDNNDNGGSENGAFDERR